jgi:hypothetical protein
MILGVFFWMIGSIWAGYFWITLLPILIYFFIALFIGIRMSKEKGVTPHRVAIAITICHWCYGAGMWRGLGRIISFRRFDSRPRGGRR